MTSTQFFRGMGVGIAMGAAISVAMYPKKKVHPMKKKAGRALHAVGDAVENLSSVLGM